MILIKFFRYCILRFWRFTYRFIEDFKKSHEFLFFTEPFRSSATRVDIFIDEPSRVFLGKNVQILKEVEMRFPKDLKKNDSCFIELQDNVFIGKRCVLDTIVNSKIFINEGTSLNHECYIGGDVYIGKNCLLAPRVHVTSGTHSFRIKPHHLIKEQDSILNGMHQGFFSSKSVIIEDDCWLGSGVFIAQGIYIGRGAIIGANSVVTHHVPPYSVFAGSPARQIGERLKFSPPSRLDPLNDEHLPYFYSGCLLDKINLEKSREYGVIFAHKEVDLLLKKDEKYKSIIIRGEFKDTYNSAINALVFVNGCLVKEKLIQNADFTLEINNINLSCVNESISQVLKEFLKVKLSFISKETVFWGIKECSLQY